MPYPDQWVLRMAGSKAAQDALLRLPQIRRTLRACRALGYLEKPEGKPARIFYDHHDRAERTHVADSSPDACHCVERRRRTLACLFVQLIRQGAGNLETVSG